MNPTRQPTTRYVVGVTPPTGATGAAAAARAREVLIRLGYSVRTEEAYVHWIRRFIVHHGRRHPRELGREEVEAFLTALAVQGGVSASTQNQARSACSCTRTTPLLRGSILKRIKVSERVRGELRVDCRPWRGIPEGVRCHANRR